MQQVRVGEFMARPLKRGLDYFPFDVDIFSDKKIRILKSHYGADGFTIYLFLLCEIYKNGYYLIADDDFIHIASDDLHMDFNKVNQVINFLLERSLFSKTLFKSDKVLTSAGIQKRYQLAVKERAKKTPINIKDYWLLSSEETESFLKVHPKSNNSENNQGFSKNNQCNSVNNDVKESKENKNKVDKSSYCKKPNPRNSFNNFEQREYPDTFISELEKKLLGG